MVSWWESGVLKSIEEIQELKSFYEALVFGPSLKNMGYYVVFFDRPPEIMCTGALQATHDFAGKQITELGDLAVPAHWLTFSLIATDDGGAAVFSWPIAHSKSADVLKTLDGLSSGERTHAVVRFAFEFFENTYFSPDWWEDLEEETRISLKKRQVRGLDPEDYHLDDCLLDDGVRVVCWEELSKKSSL